jgi:hypothetical protein
MLDTPLECIAHHEAGHAATLLLAGRRFRYVTIQATDDVLGCCVGWNAPPKFRPDIEVTPVGERFLRDTITSLLTGELADTRHCGRGDETVIHSGDDLAKAVDLASHVAGPPAEVDAYIGWLQARATAQLARPEVWAAVQAIATALIEKQRLTYAEAFAAWSAGIRTYLAELRSDRPSIFVPRA